MDLLVAYQNELLATVAILVVIFVYIIMKRKVAIEEPDKADKITKLEAETVVDTQEKSSKEIKQTVAPVEEAVPKQEEPAHTFLDGKEEGNFGIVEEEKVPQKRQEQKKSITKREVPPHAKITKENFKEFSGQRILLAEDNIINQKVIQGLLAESGIEIVIANDGVEALDILEKDNRFMMILMDAHMPRMDGFEATRKIRSNPQYNNIVVVALSGDTAADDIRKMREIGMTEHLEKPLKMDALYDVLYAYTPREINDGQDASNSELNVKEGLEISGNDSNFYHEILRQFVESYGNAHDIVDTCIKHNNLENADKLLLDIIGVSANIGATKLNKVAIALKMSLKNGDNEKSRLIFEFKENLINLIQEIKKYLQTKS